MRNKMRMMGVAIAVAGLVVTGCSSGEDTPQEPSLDTIEAISAHALDEIEKCYGDYTCVDTAIGNMRATVATKLPHSEGATLIAYADMANDSYYKLVSCDEIVTPNCNVYTAVLLRRQNTVTDMLEGYR